MKDTVDLGGQAVIEGVMIRSADTIATAVRQPDGQIIVRKETYVSLAKRVRGLGVPVVRGVVSFAEMLTIGFRTLNFSAILAAGDSPGEMSVRDRVLNALSMTVAVVVAFGLFLFVPLAICNALGLAKQAVAYNVVAGAIRVVLLLTYMWAIGFVPDIRRVFAYHGAEHQTISAYEANEDLAVGNTTKHARFHPRCGTSFLLIVVVMAITAYAFIDSGFAWVVGRPETLLERFGVHMLFLPLVSGLAYEALRATNRNRRSPVVKALIAPGLWLQHLTTRPPSEDQLAVAVVAARASLGQPVDATFHQD
jgi:uncharacterized protein YqhQ